LEVAGGRRPISGLVHLKGRGYDPLLARFISADPTVSDPLNPQGWNRYSYVGNDPLAFTDPNGFSWFSSFFHSVGNFFSEIFRSVTNFLRNNARATFLQQLKPLFRRAGNMRAATMV
jgi:RHS repeat-associated protein